MSGVWCKSEGSVVQGELHVKGGKRAPQLSSLLSPWINSFLKQVPIPVVSSLNQ